MVRATIALVVLLCASQCFAAERFALLIGNSRYENATPLRNPENDIAVVGQSLEKSGFTITQATNLRAEAMKNAINQFIAQVAKADRPVVLVYFAGHGIQRGGRNYLLPTDAKLSDADALHASAIDAAELAERLALTEAELRILILDACRDDPFESRSRGASALQGLAQSASASGQLIAYSTAPGKTAADGDTGTSPYAAAFAETVLIPGLDARSVFDRVRQKVRERTMGEQEPWESAATYGAFHFTPTTSGEQLDKAESEYWDTVALLDSAEVYQKYLKRFPEGRFAALARQKVDNLNKDFQFRKQAEVFPIIKWGREPTPLDFCRRPSGTADAFRSFANYHGQLIFLDIVSGLDGLQCPLDSDIEQFDYFGKDRPCAGAWLGGVAPLSVKKRRCFTPNEYSTSITDSALAAPDGFAAIIASGLIDLYFATGRTNSYEFTFNAVEEFFDYSYIGVTGLVRVRYEENEGHIWLYFERVEAADLGLSWKYHNTLDAYRNNKSGVAIIDLATKVSLNLDKPRPAPAPSPAIPPQPGAGLWSHNGSLMRMVVSGTSRIIQYEQPRAGLEKSGIRPATVLFSGVSPDGVTLEGTSYTFLKACGSKPFAVHGSISGTEIVLKGSAPKFNAKCRKMGTAPVTMTFAPSLPQATSSFPAAAYAEQPPAIALPPTYAAPQLQPYAPAPQFPGDREILSFWEHNGSRMLMVENGATRRLVYDQPRKELKKSGIQTSTILFEGQSLDGRVFHGKSYGFQKACGKSSFDVVGAYDGQQIILSGEAPVYDRKCRRTGARSVTLVFTAL